MSRNGLIEHFDPPFHLLAVHLVPRLIQICTDKCGRFVVTIRKPIDRWKFALAPCIEYGDFGTELLVRVAAEYAFEAGTREISPQLAVDFVDGEEVLILGVVFGKGF